MPVPQMPMGATSPTTPMRTAPSAHSTFDMAPGDAGMPKWMLAPSNTGPAAVAQHLMRPPAASAISPFVPKSRNSRVPPAPNSQASIPAVLSPPT